jgi:hypothetical protein
MLLLNRLLKNLFLSEVPFIFRKIGSKNICRRLVVFLVTGELAYGLWTVVAGWGLMGET